METNNKIDGLKSVWQNQQPEKKYNSEQIFTMLQRKSVTSVKWVFWISLIELLLGIVILPLTSTKFIEQEKMLVEKLGVIGYLFGVFTILGTIITIGFTYYFYKTYKQISVYDSVSKLMQNIIIFRKNVNRFITFNLLMVILLLPFSLFLIVDKYRTVSEGDAPVLSTILLGVAIAFVIVFGLYWLYYYLVYGTFLRRLKRNLKELQKIEN